MLDVAIARAREGFKVFPCIPNGKKPWRKGWQSWATSDVGELVDKWPPGDFNVGIATGYGFFVLDVDVHRGGLESLEQMEREHGEFQSSHYVVKTASGGFHVYLRLLPGSFVGNAVDVRPGIDVRGVGGLVVAAGSKINGRAYECIRQPAART